MLSTQSAAISATSADIKILAAFFAQLDASPKTISTYKRNIRAYTRFLNAAGLEILTATKNTIRAYKKSLEQAGKKPSTINAYLTAVRRLYSFLEAEEIKANIATNIKGCRRATNSPKQALTIEQTKALLQEPAAGARLEQLRNYAMLNLMTRRGLRTIEVCRANIEDIQQINGLAVLYLQGKGYKEKNDFIILNETCLQPIYSYLQARNCEDKTAPLFAGCGNRNKGGRLTTRTINRIVKTALKEQGIQAAELTAHSLRHTAVTIALLGGASLQETQAMARHKNINTTLIYAHNLNRLAAGAEYKIDDVLCA
jgi:integrase/recombinase XerD